MTQNVQTKCPHGYVAEYVYRKRTVDGQEYVVGGDYWHDEYERCDRSAPRSPRSSSPTCLKL